jgi:Putative MetA-pathway of phenol degradation
VLLTIAATARAQIALADGDESPVDNPAAPAPVFQPRPPAPPSADLNSPRRRGSMVGYIDDAVVSSKLRVRFETALHDNLPDRAEFFYAKCGCYRFLPTTNSAYDPAAPGPGPGIVTDLNFQQAYVQGEYAPTDRFSVFAELPTRWIQPQSFAGGGPGFANQAGIGDLRAGVKLALLDAPDHQLTVQLRSYLPTGDAGSGLGTNHWSVEPAILYYQQVSDRVAVESQVNVWVPIGGSIGVPPATGGNFSGSVFSYGIGPSFEVYRSGSVRFVPVVELVGWHVLAGQQTEPPASSEPTDASGTNIVNLKIGARTSWDRRESIYVGYGRALTTSHWYEDIVRVEYRYSF